MDFPIRTSEAYLVSVRSAHPGLSLADVSLWNSQPVANAGSDQETVVDARVRLDGEDSTDADDDPLTYQWALLSRPLGSEAVLSDDTAVSPTFVPDLPGAYVAQLLVSDGQLPSGSDTVTINMADVIPGQAVSYVISLDSTSGFAQLTALMVSELPTGVTASFTPP